ncbi:MAG: hypothetical protein ACREJU_12145 [Nitrospiraceae bacterium]
MRRAPDCNLDDLDFSSPEFTWNQILLEIISAESAFAGPATEAIKRTHERVLDVLHDEELKKPEGAG